MDSTDLTVINALLLAVVFLAGYVFRGWLDGGGDGVDPDSAWYRDFELHDRTHKVALVSAGVHKVIFCQTPVPAFYDADNHNTVYPDIALFYSGDKEILICEIERCINVLKRTA